VPQFTRAFRASTGTSPARYVREQRIARATVLLRDGRRPLAEIAVAAGFADQQHFTRRFREATGRTPGAYRDGLA
jgi:AraC family transcriptional regulator